MSRIRRTCGGALARGALLTTVAGPALASEPGGATALVWQAVNLALLLTVLFLMARKPVSRFFAQRRTRIHGEVQNAADLLGRAESRFAEWQRKLVELDSAVDEIRDVSRRRSEDERARILAEAHEAAERIRRDASAAVAQELRRARDTLQREAAELATELAEKLLREQVVDSDRERLIDEFISRVEQGPAAGDSR